MSELKQDENQVLGKAERIDFYLKTLGKLKERNMLREVLEREVFLEFIKFNNSRINEFPLLEKQQSGIITLLCHRSVDLPAHEYIKKILNEFILMLGRFGKLKNSKDEDQIEIIKSKIINSETILIKCVQGVVYGSCLISDNFEEVTLRHFGQPALKRYNDLLEEFELDKNFWKKLINDFVTLEVESAFESVVERNTYSLTRDKKYLILRFPFDEITRSMQVGNQKIDKTRIQGAYEQVGADKASFENLKYIFKSLGDNPSFVHVEGISNEHLERIARIVSIDPATASYHETYTSSMEELRKISGNYDNEKEESIARNLQFTQDQIGACATGVSLTLDIIVRDFLLGLHAYTNTEKKVISAYLRKIDVSSLDALFFYLIEMKFLRLLKKKIEGEEGKMLLRVTKRRRAKTSDLDRLTEKGLSRIRRARLFVKDSSDDWMLFKHGTAKEIVEEMQLLALEKDLAREILKIYEKGEFRTEFLIFISLESIVKITKDVKGKLNELLNRFGIGEQNEDQMVKNLQSNQKAEG